MFDDGQLYRVLRDAASLGIPVQVQCENGPLIDALTAELVAVGRDGARRLPALASRRRRGRGGRPHARGRGPRRRAGVPRPPLDRGVDRVRGGGPHARRADHGRGLHPPPAARRASLYARPDAGSLRRRAAAADCRGRRRALGGDPRRRGRYRRLGPLAPAAFPRPIAGTTFLEAPMGLPGMELRLPLVLSEGSETGRPARAPRARPLDRARAGVRDPSAEGLAGAGVGCRRRRVGSASACADQRRRPARGARAQPVRGARAPRTRPPQRDRRTGLRARRRRDRRAHGRALRLAASRSGLGARPEPVGVAPRAARRSVAAPSRDPSVRA